VCVYRLQAQNHSGEAELGETYNGVYIVNEQELNKKLAEWAGWRNVHIVHPLNKVVGLTKQSPPVDWVEANFTASLDACFKWLVPKLRKTADCVMDMGVTEYKVTIWGEDLVTTTDKNPALALCLAVEKLIDNEKKTM